MSNTNEGPKKVGRPTLEQTMTPMWKQIMLDAGRDGQHISHFLIELGISWQSHYNLLNRSIEYQKTFSEYQKLCEEWWFQKARESMIEENGMGFNTRLWQVIMTNKFKDHWRSERQIDITTQGEKIESTPSPIQIEIIKKDIDLND